jgi:hypothetical protein
MLPHSRFVSIPSRLKRNLLPLATAALAICAMPVIPAFAHVTLETAEAKANSTYKAVLRVGHGCKGEATQTLRVQIPEGVIAVKPSPKPGWTLTTVIGRYDRTYDYFGTPLSEGVKEIVWSGGSLADAHYDEFVFRARITDMGGESAIFFPTVQECATASERWTEIPARGEDPHKLKSPAPDLTIVQAQHGGHGSHGASAKPAPAGAERVYRAGDLVITAPWARATPGGARVAGGYLAITNTGKEPDILTGGTASFAGRFEVHDMAVTDGIMRMREAEQGLTIRPGETLELKPGGVHVMFMDLKQPLRQGQTFKGTLSFAKAGQVDIEFKVGGIAARSDAAGGDSGGHKH